MNDIEESMEKYDPPFSEQAVDGGEYASAGLPISSPDRRQFAVRVLALACRKAEDLIGHPPRETSLRDRVKWLLDGARAHNLDAKTYEILWFIYRTAKAHVIIDNGANPIIIGESA